MTPCTAFTRQQTAAKRPTASVANGLLLLTTLALMNPVFVSGVTKCAKVTYKYGDSPESECKGKEFWVNRCAASETELNAWLTGKKLEERMQPNTCKLAWLMACATFEGDAVVVPKSIKCNEFMCDQSGYLSNCFEDAHCDGIDSIDGGQPEAGTSWPLANHSKDGSDGRPAMPYYRPCCDFYKEQCNGAVCAQDSGCPLDIANQTGFCDFVKDGKPCWMPLLKEPNIDAAGRASYSAVLISALIAAVVALHTL